MKCTSCGQPHEWDEDGYPPEGKTSPNQFRFICTECITLITSERFWSGRIWS